MRLFKIILLCFVCTCSYVPLSAQDSTAVQIEQHIVVDSTQADSAQQSKQQHELEILLKKNQYLNSIATPQPMPIQPRNASQNNIIFYVIAFLCLIFGLSKYINPKYFSTVFRVFFNSTLRQSQITDQLVQSQLPALFYNCFFFVTGGFYLFFILRYFHFGHEHIDWKMIQICVAALAILYLGKFVVLKFIGWVTGYNTTVDIYIYVTYLINKIIGICLLPFLIILAFADHQLETVAVILSLSLIVLLLFMRFFKSFGLLQHGLQVGIFHFILYIFSLEVLPLLLIYRAASVYLGIKL